MKNLQPIKAQILNLGTSEIILVTVFVIVLIVIISIVANLIRKR